MGGVTYWGSIAHTFVDISELFMIKCEMIIANISTLDLLDDIVSSTLHLHTLILQVEFPPTFEEQPMSEQWSWDQNPINLTCIATAIPNATITWWYRDREINREIIDRNYRVFGHGPRSDLIVTPLDLQYYGRYTCKAINPHGEAFYEIGL